MERSTGPFKGYYVAVYACAVGELGREYVGYYKVCRAQPVDYWEADCILKGCADGLRITSDGALEDAEEAALAQIARLPALNQLPWFLMTRPMDRRELDFLQSIGSLDG